MTITFGIVARIQCFIEFSICLEDIPICLRRKAVEAMRFVDNEQIPVGGEDVVVFLVLSAHVFRSAQVLQGGKTHNVRTCVGLQQQLVEALPLLRRTVVVFSL